MGRHAPVEAKVIAATAASYITSVWLLAVLAVIEDGERLLAVLPDSLSPFLLALVPALGTFRSGWQARHTPRLGAW